MTTHVFIICLIFVTLKSFGQSVFDATSTHKPHYNKDSQMRIIYDTPITSLYKKVKHVAVYVNEIFIGNEQILPTINADKIHSVPTKKLNFENNGKQY